jgi:Zn-dependent M28 family amino/carboxypeptidase
MSNRCNVSDRSLLRENGIDVIQVIVGVLIARIIVVWMDVVKHYVCWVTYSEDEYHEAYIKFNSRWRSALLSTVIIIVVIIIILAWYTRYKY